MIKTHFDIYKYKNDYGAITYKDAAVGDYSFGIDNIVDISDIRLFVERLKALRRVQDKHLLPRIKQCGYKATTDAGRDRRQALSEYVGSGQGTMSSLQIKVYGNSTSKTWTVNVIDGNRQYLPLKPRENAESLVTHIRQNYNNLNEYNEWCKQ